MNDLIAKKINIILDKYKAKNMTSSQILRIEDDINEIPEVYNIIVHVVDNRIHVKYKIDECPGEYNCAGDYEICKEISNG